MRVAVFGGSFDPVHLEHVRLAETAVEKLRLDKLIVMPSFVAPHKAGGAAIGGAERLALCRLAFRGRDRIEVSPYEIEKGGVSYTYLTCRAFQKKYPCAERFFLVGADMLDNFYSWKEPEQILSCVKLVACGRVDAIKKEEHARFQSRFLTDFEELDFIGNDLTSCAIRVALACGREAAGLDGNVFAYIQKNGLYMHPEIVSALKLEKKERQEHSFRVAVLACQRARSLKIPEEKALLAGALHDCGKNVSPFFEPLKGFLPPPNVPAPVLHQFVGAYLAKEVFGVSDEDVLNAIRYHTSARAGMSELEKLIYLADLLEPERIYPGVEALRGLFWKDLDACLIRALKEQIEYLRGEKKPVYSLTEEAYRWILKSENRKN